MQPESNAGQLISELNDANGGYYNIVLRDTNGDVQTLMSRTMKDNPNYSSLVNVFFIERTAISSGEINRTI